MERRYLIDRFALRNYVLKRVFKTKFGVTFMIFFYLDWRIIIALKICLF